MQAWISAATSEGRRLRWPRVPAAGVWAAGAVPGALLLWRTAAGRLGADPVEHLLHATGFWGLTFLLAALAVTPLRLHLGASALAPHRRTLGLLAFGYATLHLTVYLAIDQGLELNAILEDVGRRLYVTAGFAAWLLLLPLAATSSRQMTRRLGAERWKRLHALAYLAGGLAVLHFLWQVKADALRPLVFAALLLLLLAARLHRR